MRLRGAVERKTSQFVSGWLSITGEENGPPILEVIYRGRVFGRTIAYLPRPDVRDAGYGDGNCGFSLRLPPELENVDPNEIELHLVGTELYLHARRDSSVEESPILHGKGSVFVLGPARSGTSVIFLALQKVLGLSGLGESHVPQIFQRLVYQFYEYVRSFQANDGVLAQRLQVPEFQDYIVTYLRRFYFNQFAGAPFVDKTPGLEAIVGAPFLKQAFPGGKIIVMEREGIEVIESYRKKFNASFEEALREWSSCAAEISKLKRTMPEILFLSQNELRADPEMVARKLATHVGRPENAEGLALFFRTSREDVLSDPSSWQRQMTLDEVQWIEQEKELYICSRGD